MNLSCETIQKDPRTVVLHVDEGIDYANYKDLINYVWEKFFGKDIYLIIDFEKCDFISISGVFALHSIALLAHQFLPQRSEDGWNALRNISDETRNLKKRLKIIHLQSKVKEVLENNGLLSHLDCIC